MNKFYDPPPAYEYYPASLRYTIESFEFIETILFLLPVAAFFMGTFMLVYYRERKPNFLWAILAAGFCLTLSYFSVNTMDYEKLYPLAEYIYGNPYVFPASTIYNEILSLLGSLFMWLVIPSAVIAAYLGSGSKLRVRTPSKTKIPKIFNMPEIPALTKTIRLIRYSFKFLSFFLEVFVVRVAAEVSIDLSTPNRIRVAEGLFVAVFFTVGMYGYYIVGNEQFSIAISIALTFVALAFLLFLILILIFGKRASPSAIKRDADTVSDSEFINRATSLMSASAGVWSGSLNGRDLFVSCQDRAVVIGPPGTGKTSFLVSQLLKWAESGRSFVCLDIKPEIYGITRAALEAKGYRLLTYNPTSSTGQRYNPISDLDSPESVGELAAALVPADSPEYAVFFESARDILDGLISHLRAAGDRVPTLPDVRDFLSQCDDHRQLLGLLHKSPDPDARELASGLAMVSRNERILGSVFGILRANLRFLRYPAIRQSLEAADFSLADLVADRPVGLFLQFEEAHAETTSRLLSAMVGHLLRYLITHHNRPPVLLLLDEIGNAPPVPGLVQKLNTIRSRNLPTWLYFQSLEQMQRYGQKTDEGPNLILGACDYQAVFRLNDNASADWMSKRIGVVDRTIESVSITNEGSETASHQIVTEPRIFPHEFQQLPDGHVCCVYRGMALFCEATPYFRLWPEFDGRQPIGGQLLGPVYPSLTPGSVGEN